jgi:hypothetical protein
VGDDTQLRVKPRSGTCTVVSGRRFPVHAGGDRPGARTWELVKSAAAETVLLYCMHDEYLSWEYVWTAPSV